MWTTFYIMTADSHFPIWASEARREAIMTEESHIKWLRIADLLYLTFVNMNLQGLGHEYRQFCAIVYVYVSLAQ